MEQEQQNAVDIARLDERVTGMDDKLDTILGNHLPHLAQAIKDLDEKHDQTREKFAKWNGGIAVLVILIPVILFIIGKFWH